MRLAPVAATSMQTKTTTLSRRRQGLGQLRPVAERVLKPRQAEAPPEACRRRIDQRRTRRVSDLPAVWQRLLDLLAARGPALHSLVMHGKLVGIEDDSAVISLRPQARDVRQDARAQRQEGPRPRRALAGAGRPLGVRFDIDAEPEPPRSRDGSHASNRAAARTPVAARSVRVPVEPPEPGAGARRDRASRRS